MTKRLDFKPEGCKLLRVEIELEGELVLRAFVRGDFFAHPEEAFEAAEAALAGSSRSSLAEAARASFSRSGLTLHGVNADAIADTLARTLDAAPLP